MNPPDVVTFPDEASFCLFLDSTKCSLSKFRIANTTYAPLQIKVSTTYQKVFTLDVISFEDRDYCKKLKLFLRSRGYTSTRHIARKIMSLYLCHTFQMQPFSTPLMWGVINDQEGFIIRSKEEGVFTHKENTRIRDFTWVCNPKKDVFILSFLYDRGLKTINYFNLAVISTAYPIYNPKNLEAFRFVPIVTPKNLSYLHHLQSRLPFFQDLLNKDLEDKTSRFDHFAILDNNKIIAAITLVRITPDLVVLMDAVTQPDYRKQGIQKKLVSHCLNFVRERGTTHAFAFLNPAIELKQGFESLYEFLMLKRPPKLLE